MPIWKNCMDEKLEKIDDGIVINVSCEGRKENHFFRWLFTHMTAARMETGFTSE